ncbi:ABC-type transport auxiliary lipoprotein family protein [Sphingorhabdus sp. Alg239-R122]|uniref:ABC-type transport auxiliary lipoprotein family protein n=1 Tax=Sphingorhabdus sp. Alg239-R122 TaxID=2305989 RepID=UPI0013DB80D7|nr:ABC-type transport auxiliary lipoprotein family protein [Sphingorhabdus sp. Alg239-R122]
MRQIFKSLTIPALAAVTLAGCVSFGSEPPPSLLTLTPDSEIAAGTSRSGPVASAIIVDMPTTERKLDNLRVPVQIDDSSIAYLKEAVWVDRPSRLFRTLLSETIAARSGRLVLDKVEISGQSSSRISGTLVDFGYDARTAQAVVAFDAIRRSGAGEVEKRRFEARENVSAPEAGPVGTALNRAANRVAVEISDWVG